MAEVTSEESINGFNMWVFLSSSVRVGVEEKQSTPCFCRKCPLIIQLILRNLERGNLPEKPTHTLDLTHAYAYTCTTGSSDRALMKLSEAKERGR